MTKKLFQTPDEQAELDRLFAEHEAASLRAIEARRTGDAELFREEDRKAGECFVRIKELEATAGRPWNA